MIFRSLVLKNVTFQRIKKSSELYLPNFLYQASDAQRSYEIEEWKLESIEIDECYASFVSANKTVKHECHENEISRVLSQKWPHDHVISWVDTFICSYFYSIIIQWSRWCKCVFRPVVKPDRGSVTRKSAVQNVVKCGKNFPSSQLWIHSIIWFISRLFKNLSPQDCNTRYP